MQICSAQQFAWSLRFRRVYARAVCNRMQCGKRRRFCRRRKTRRNVRRCRKRRGDVHENNDDQHKLKGIASRSHKRAHSRFHSMRRHSSEPQDARALTIRSPSFDGAVANTCACTRARAPRAGRRQLGARCRVVGDHAAAAAATSAGHVEVSQSHECNIAARVCNKYRASRASRRRAYAPRQLCFASRQLARDRSRY